MVSPISFTVAKLRVYTFLLLLRRGGRGKDSSSILETELELLLPL